MIVLFLCAMGASIAQTDKKSAGDIKNNIDKLNVLGTVLYFAAHPDDENTRLIAWLAQERKYRTGYLSLTRGDGGQNLIGTELGIDLGLIRTQELLAARRIDKGEQFFSSAYDFGFSKTHEETFAFWDKETALREAVWIIRKFQPDIIITRFPPDKRGGHGHHQASAILAHEAFVAAADPGQYPEQLQELAPWQAKRLIWNTANFGGMNNTSDQQLKVDIGAYNPLLGTSYGEIAALSRSQHKSQGFGAASTRGKSIEYFEHVAGTEAKNDLMDGISTSWERIPKTQNIQKLIAAISNNFDPAQPQNSIEKLFELRSLVQKIDNAYWKKEKTKEIEELIIVCAGIWIDAITTQPQFVQHQEIPVTVEAIVRNPNTSVKVAKIDHTTISSLLPYNELWKGQQKIKWNNTTQPYWLKKPHSLGKFDVDPRDIGYPTNPEKPSLAVTLHIGKHEITVHREVQYRTVDPVYGEVYQPIVVLPALTVELSKKSLLFTDTAEQDLSIIFTNNDNNTKYYEVLAHSTKGWEYATDLLSLDFSNDKQVTKTIRIKPTAKEIQKGTISFINQGKELQQIKTISYPHIPGITWFPDAEINLETIDLINPVHKVAYIPGAGDLVPESLQQIGIEVSTLSPQQVTVKNLEQFDAVIIGVRYFNVNEQSGEMVKTLLTYVQAGGVVLAQYNVNTRLSTAQLGPYPFTLSRDRVTEEDARVSFDSDDIVFNYPNKITAKDFDNWVQERGLYFANNINDRYRTPLQINDKGEASHNGSLLIANYGKGKFVYTSLSFFRQLPAGIPGAYRLFVNLLSKEKTNN